MATAILRNSTDRMPRTGILGGVAVVVIVFSLFAWALRRAIPTHASNAAMGTETTTNPTGAESSVGSTNVNRTTPDLNNDKATSIPGGMPNTHH